MVAKMSPKKHNQKVVTMTKRRKPVRIESRSKFISKFGNIDYLIELECGHIIGRTFKRGVDPLRKPYYFCSQCTDEKG